MKKLNAILAALGLILAINACTPIENVQPQHDQETLEKFDVKGPDTEPKKPGGQ